MAMAPVSPERITILEGHMCEEASRLLARYSAALLDFHQVQAPLLRGLKPGSPEFAGTIDAKHAVQAVLLQARREYWDHVRSHGCRERPAQPEEASAPFSEGDSYRLWEQVQDTKRELDLAHDAVCEAQHELRSGVLPAPDGRYAYTQALRAQNLALSQYTAALGGLQAAVLASRVVGHDPNTQAERSRNGDSRKAGVLTRRELEVLTHIAGGKSSRQIAGLLGIAFKTVVVHRHHIQTKLKVHNTADLTRIALRMGLIDA